MSSFNLLLEIKTPAADALELTTLRTEAEALINGVQEISSQVEQKGPENEAEARTLKIMLLSLKAQAWRKFLQLKCGS